ncbi:hypothetical protein G6F56_010463 [Rhizopus delemar]|nr:hypothetical protein G6F56_010463 [Rhizopus delemar]
MHSQRQLSIRGRATVLNTLIYSKLWHILRLFPFTKVQLQQIISIGSSFINRNIFPRISIATLQLPRNKGGLGILNPVTQQHALQWRWISPVLQSDILDNSSNCLYFLRYTLQWFFHSNVFPSYRYYLLFPICRQTQFFFFRFSNQSFPLNILNTFIHTVDSLPKGLEDCHIDPFTCLSLPFITAIKPAAMVPPSGVLSPGLSVEQALFLHPGFRKLVCSDVFTFDYTTLQLRLRSAPFNNAKHPTLAKAAVFLIQSNQLRLHSFFNYNCQPAPRHQPPPSLALQQRICSI